ncbi:MAG TPA: ribose-phosphate pyrophosphokinase [candidate division Zixibacteria bacterium]|nr:ribose-phosphate pyrophosphokinase [candidate division Zixibacteria bacterium]
MSLKVLSGSSHPKLAERVAAALGLEPVRRVLERFPDSELHLELQESVRGDDVYVLQPTSPPVDEHLLELLLMADACRRAGAGRLTAVLPYFGYARQDRRARGREPVSARLVCDLIAACGYRRLVAVDLHSRAIETALTIPLEHLSAVPILAEAVRPSISSDAVVVSPDLGAVKMAERYAAFLDLPVAIAHKTRISGTEVSVRRIVGEVRGREVLLVDDMISTGGTLEKAIEALLDAGCSPHGIKVAASHALLAGPAARLLGKLPVEKIYTCDSVSVAAGFPVPIQISPLAPLLAEALRRLHNEESLAGLVNP